MNGKGFLLDTNAIIQLLKGNKGLLSIISGADFIATSIISEMEYFWFIKEFSGTTCRWVIETPSV